ncbi:MULTISPECIES: S8 family serine peptidase [unclassified Streptomyces]|uniref:S8 family serine peptidase n=1 Tax=unclassified Streptomyces TaxID=2593676 RepID=UPI002DD81B82|nr:S8 family serine peptidase [Streptomyces sp. NBC_01763]WSC34914.1 S8 family serine peptidase [Streptomyces sp. NBC_01763]WSF88914.1 S8 family serine peptidase [Streptomyces sp. NBC_01744]
MTRASARRRSRLLAAGLSLVLLPAGQAVAAGAVGTAGAGTDRATAPVHAPTTPRTVTLITGDQVTVTDLGAGRKSVAVERPEGATGAVRSEISGGRITVIPDEARPYLQAGVLDAELFDVTALIEQGLGDPSSDGLPLIVTYTKNARSATPHGARQVRGLPSVGGAALEASTSGEFWRTVAPDVTSGARSTASGRVRLAGGVEKIWLDARVDAAMETSNAQIGTPAAWEAGLTGKGVKVAVLDTGVDLTHPDLEDRVTETKSFIEGQEVADRHGHGTHVSSTVGGSGAASDGKEKGVAPDATLAVGKVLSDQGSGTESQIIAGMEWAAKDIHARIVSMSLGSSEGSDGTDPMAEAVNTLSKETGALFVIAAGNAGSPGTIGSPGAADSALTIGAVDPADKRAYFSSQGPRLGDKALKPDLSAPGVNILAARSQLVTGSGPYTSMSGTSMATPHVAGVAALLAQKHPDWTGQQLKDGLMSTSKQISGTSYEVGAGRVDVPSAIAAKITATGSADLGFTSWPYEANKPVTKTLTYTNASDRPVTLALSAEGAPAGVVTLADSTLTVPAHGTAQTTVTGDGTGALVGTTSGRIVAKDGDTVVAHTAFGLTKEEERYTLTVHVKDRDGAATAAHLAVKKLAQGVDPFPATVDDSGTLRLRLQPGTYTLSTFLDVRGSKGKDSLGLGLLTEPEVTLDRDREVTLDGRTLREIRAQVDQRTQTRQLLMKFNRAANGASYTGAVQVPLKYDSIFAAPTHKPATGTFEYRTVWRLGKPRLDVEAGGKRLGETVVQPGSDLFTGRKRMYLVDAGTGSAAAYAGKNVKGKAVVVRRTDAITPAELAQNAQDAGAKALFVTDAVPGRLSATFSGADGATRPLYIATVNAVDGARLIAAARLHRDVELTGTENTPYVYDLTKGYPGAIPTDLTYRPGKNELAVVDSRFHATKAANGGEFRYSITDTFPIGIGFQEKIKFPAERTDYISAGPDQGWHESMSNGPGAIEQRGGIVHYRGGTHSGTDWFKPVWHPWLGTGLGWGQQRAGNNLQFNTPGWGDSGPDHTGFGDVWNESSMTQFTEVYVDGVRVDRKTSSGAYARNVKPTEQDFKVVTDTTLDPDVWRLATKGHSEWTFKSSATPADRWTYLPMLNLGFDVDTDLHGDVRAGKRLDLGIFSEYVKGAPDTGRITGSTLEVSFDDGATWTSVELDGVRGKSAVWAGSVRVPDDAQYISLRASAADDRGGSVKQEIIRAVGVRK